MVEERTFSVKVQSIYRGWCEVSTSCTDCLVGSIACQIGDTLPSDIVNWRTSVSHSLEEDNEDN